MTSDYIEDCRTAAALYSLGALPPEEAKQFEQRLSSGCPFCSSEFAAYASITDEFALSAPVRDPDSALRQRLLDRIRAMPEAESGSQEMIVVRDGERIWMPLLTPGIEVRPLFGERTLLVRMQAGAVYPPHEHRYAEQCYVLEGSITDNKGVTVFAGDFVCMPAGSTHGEIRSETGCMFLLAYTA
jgi:mannose-6-phosphate isomerase-like protein (cupin superfamily)